MTVGDTMKVLGRSQCREGGAENNCSGKRKCFAEHFYLPVDLCNALALSYECLPMVFIPSRWGEKDRGEYRQAARAIAEAIKANNDSAFEPSSTDAVRAEGRERLFSYFIPSQASEARPSVLTWRSCRSYYTTQLLK
jgi:predicted RNase H-like nuclease